MKKLLLIGGAFGACAVVLLGVGAAVLIGASALFGDYGTRIELQKGELYYCETVTSKEALSLADFLNEQYGELDNEISFQVDRVDGDVCLRMCTQSIAWETDDMDYSFHALELLVQTTIFKNENVKVQMCDEFMTVKKTIDMCPPETSNVLSDAMATAGN